MRKEGEEGEDCEKLQNPLRKFSDTPSEMSFLDMDTWTVIVLNGNKVEQAGAEARVVEKLRETRESRQESFRSSQAKEPGAA